MAIFVTDTIYKLSEKAGILCYILITMKSFFDFLTDSETKRKYYKRYYKRYWKEILERK